MNWAGYSNLAIVTCWVLYLVAMVCHALEWATAGRLRSTSGATQRPRALATAGAPAAAELDDELPEATRSDSGGSDQASSEAAVERADRFGRIGLALTTVGFLAAVFGIVARGVAAQRAPWGNMYEFITSAMVFLVAGYLYVAFRRGQRWLGLFVTLLAALGNGLAITAFYVGVAPLVPALHSVWFVIHIVAAAVAGAAFNLGGLASIVYLLRDKVEGTRLGDMLPSKTQIDRIAFRTHAFAFPLWTFAVAAGAVWAQYAWGRPWNWDPKETWALVTWIIYAGYLHARATAGWRGHRSAWIAIVGVASFWFNFVGVNLLFSGLHSYGGIS